MDLPFVARVALTVVFAASGVYCLLRCAHWSPPRRVVARSVASGPECTQSAPDQGSGAGCHDDGAGHGRAVDLAQVAMSVAMVAMLVTGVGGDRWGVQATVFAVAGTWFLTRALPGAGRAAAGGSATPGARTGLVNHAVMMGGMVWMSVAMSRAAAPMDMAATAPVRPATVMSLAIAGYLAVAAVWWGRRSLVTAGSGGLFGVTGATTCHAVTSAAMAVAVVLRIHA